MSDKRTDGKGWEKRESSLSSQDVTLLSSTETVYTLMDSSARVRGGSRVQGRIKDGGGRYRSRSGYVLSIGSETSLDFASDERNFSSSS